MSCGAVGVASFDVHIDFKLESWMPSASYIWVSFVWLCSNNVIQSSERIGIIVTSTMFVVHIPSERIVSSHTQRPTHPRKKRIGALTMSSIHIPSKARCNVNQFCDTRELNQSHQHLRQLGRKRCGTNIYYCENATAMFLDKRWFFGSMLA